MLTLLRTSAVLLALLTVVTGFVYPLLVTGTAQVVFSDEANGSLVLEDGRVVGSELIGQPFDDPRYFWGRPSATSTHPYDAAASTGSNLGPSNPVLAEAVAGRVAALREASPELAAEPVPVDLVTASGSGLDPDISPAAALYQVSRVARTRGLAEAEVRALVDRHVEGRTFGLFGEPRVNVLRLNMALDHLGRPGS